MTDQVILPTADAVITPVLEKLYELRPNSFKHLNLRSGVYWHPVCGFRAQAASLLDRLAQLVAERRLNTAEGQALLDYVASEFDPIPETGKTFAEGTVTLGRGPEIALPGGDYPAGTRVTRTPFVHLGIEFPGAEWETITDSHIDVNSTAPVTIPIRATASGPEANTPILTVPSPVTGITLNPNPVFNVVVTDIRTAGGSNKPQDSFVRLFAKSYAVGQYGPTVSASRLGGLSGLGARHVLAYDAPTIGTQKILVADESWASASRWVGGFKSAMLAEDLIGFGCKVAFDELRNRAIVVDAIISLRDTNYLSSTTEVEIAVRKAVRSYFDDRLDWNVWNTGNLEAVISRAHSKIFTCESAIVRDSATGAVIEEITTPNYALEQLHFYLASNAMNITFEGPI